MLEKAVKTMAETDLNIDKIRVLEFDETSILNAKTFAKENDYDLYEVITYVMLNKDSDINKKEYSSFKKGINYENATQIKEIINLYKGIFEDLKYFPVAKSSNKRTDFVDFENSWQDKRNYGGERFHEGTDIMPRENISGKYPVISMCDGVVENIGWLKLGGYRIGIRSFNGLYIYYAHLDSYSKEYKVGDTVKAGEHIGFMGDTGYSEVEGTKGNFLVHLHLGIYTDYQGKEMSLNPYYILLYLKKKLLYYNY